MKDPDYESNKFDSLTNDSKNREFIEEWIAQMFAYLCLDNDVEIEFMKEFANKQPTEYSTFLKDRNMNIEDFKEDAGLLKLKEVYEFIAKYIRIKKISILINSIKSFAENKEGKSLKGINNAAKVVGIANKYDC